MTTIASFKGAANDSLEGFLFPKTYSLGDSPTADDVIRAMLDQFKTEYKSLDFASCEAKIKERYGVEMSDYDIVNLASIVEREDSTPINVHTWPRSSTTALPASSTVCAISTAMRP